MTPPILELRDVEATYGPFRALFGLSLQVPAGNAVALLGPNGAGKTTVARVATGLLAPVAGRVLVGGRDMTGRRPYAFARAGLGHAPEGRSVFASLTVEENLTLALRWALGRQRLGPALEQAYEMFPVLGQRRGQLAGTLSGGEQRMLAICRVLVAPPRLLVADELSLGLAPVVVDEVYEALGRLRSKGVSLLIVEQQVGHALDISDWVVQLDHGLIAWQGPADQARDRLATGLFRGP